LKKERKLPKLSLQRETLRSLAGGLEYVYSRINNTVYSGDVGCQPVTGTCQSACAVCQA
jgi:hypothetical protein